MDEVQDIETLKQRYEKMSHKKTEAETAFRQAIDIARRQDAKSWELRAVMSLSRLLGRRGKRGLHAFLGSLLRGAGTEGDWLAKLRRRGVALTRTAQGRPFSQPNFTPAAAPSGHPSSANTRRAGSP